MDEKYCAMIQQSIHPEFVLIDLDGTLIDSVPDLAFCIDGMMSQLGLPKCGQEAVREWVGNGVKRLVERALVNSIEGRPDPALMAQAYPIFLELYAQNNAQRSSVYDGVVEGLQWMKEQGYRMGCVTNKAEAFTIPLLKSKQLLDWFDIVVSGDTCLKKKPDPMPLLYAAERMNVSINKVLMIGDSRSDVRAAHAAGSHIFCVTYGYNHGEDIRLHQPDVVMDSFLELSNYLVGKA